MATTKHQNHPQNHRVQMDSPGQAYFDVEGDKELQAKSFASEQDGSLTWRGDPHETMSDWTIVVVTEELETTTYHVHKNVLCFGPRSCKYFAKLILNQQPSSHRKTKHRHQQNTPAANTTKVELDQQDADNFPILLDFIYALCTHNVSSGGTVLTAASTFSSPSLLTATSTDESLLTLSEDISFHNAVSLRHMARLFEIDSLMLAVNKFIQKDLNFKTGPKYLMQASEYNDQRLLESAQRLCVDNFEEMDIKTLSKLPLQNFCTLIKSLEDEDYKEDNDSLSRFMSEVVCRYLEKHPKHLSAELLVELTDSLLMPCMASEAAIGFTALIKKIDQDDASIHWNGLVELSRRCARSVVKEYGWNDFSVTAAVDEYLGNTRTGPTNGVSRTDSLLFATSFAAALEQAQDDYEQVVVEQEQLEVTVNTLFQSVSLLELSNQKKDEHLVKQQKAIQDAKKQILKLKKQVGEIKMCHLNKRPPAEIHLTPPARELMAPSRIPTEEIQRVKAKKIQELRTKSEMRSRSLLV